MTPALLPLTADRGITFNEPIAFFGILFAGSTYRMQVRLEPDSPGGAIISLTTTTSSSAAGVRLVYSGSATLAAHVAAGRITQAQANAAKLANGYSDTDSVDLSVLNLRILAATMALASYPADEAGDELPLHYDLLATLPGGDELKYVYGPFTVRGTVTQ